jgi:hypothetical protein
MGGTLQQGGASDAAKSSALIPSGTAAIHTIPTQVEGDIGTIRTASTVASLAELTERRNPDA